MKRFLIICLAVVSVMVLFPMFVHADILGEATILNTGENLSSSGDYYWNYPLGYVTWTGANYVPIDPDGVPPNLNSIGYHAWSLNYTASVNGSPSLWDVYCTEVEMDNPSTTTNYTLLSIDSSLGGFFAGDETTQNSIAKAYMAAAWLADNHGYTAGGDQSQSDKALAQLVMWEIIKDGVDQFDLSDGLFRSVDRADWNNWKGTDYNDPALEMYNAMVTATSNLTDFGTSNWVLAVNPTIEAGDTVGIEYAQNYLIRNPIPEPATMILFGIGLLGLVGVGRRKLKK